MARERINGLLSTEVSLMHAAMIAVMSPKGEGVKNLKKLLKGLQDGN